MLRHVVGRAQATWRMVEAEDVVEHVEMGQLCGEPLLWRGPADAAQQSCLAAQQFYSVEMQEGER